MTSRHLVAAFGLLILVLSTFIVVSPSSLEQFVEKVLTPTGIWVAAGFRLTLGVLLWVAADTSRTPRIFRVLGVLFVLGGLAIPIIGLDRVEAVMEWEEAKGDLFLRGSGLIGVAMGAFLVWSAVPRRPAP